MSLDALIIFAGAVIAILPFLGFPSIWDRAFFFILGLLVVALGIAVRRRLSQRIHTQQPPFDEQSPEDR